MTNIMPLIPASGSVFKNMPLTNNKELNELRKKCELDMKQMFHCRQCRADAIGLLEKDISSVFRGKGCGGCSSGKNETAPVKTKGKEDVYQFAIASKSGMMVDEHFGQLNEFYIYMYENEEVSFVEKRKVIKFCTGEDQCESEESKISNMADTVSDCNAVLVLRIGYNPSKILEDMGISVIQTCGGIYEAIHYAVVTLKKEKEKLRKVI